MLLGSLAALAALCSCKVPFTADCKAGEEVCKPCPACGEDEVCLKGRCLPRSCGPATPCHQGYACLSGRCVDASCVDRTCAEGEACAGGACYPADCPDQDCSPSEVCDGAACTFAGCAGVACPEGEACAGGECRPLSCSGVVCAAGTVCGSAGACVDARCVGVLCGEGFVCWAGNCVDQFPKVAITAPNGGADFTTNVKSQTVSGTCSKDTVALSTSKGVFADRDCLDGTWGLKALDLAAGANTFTVTARNAPGGEATSKLVITYDPPPEVKISSPDDDGSAYAYARAATVSGTCSGDVVEVAADRGTVADGDCSDGNWSLEPYPLPQLGPYPFKVTVRDSFGSTASASITVTFTHLKLEDGTATVWRKDNPTTVRGRCSTEVASVTASAGTIVDGDCSDGTLSISLPFGSGDGKYPLTATGTTPTESESDDLEVVYDTVPPVSVVTSTTPASPSENNFPVVKGTTESGARVQLYADAACTVAVSHTLASWESGDFTSKGITVAVVDGTTTSLHARAIDRAGNLGPCSAGLDYTDSTSGLPACDVTVAGPALTFAQLQAVLDDADARRSELAADGAIAVCLADGVVVSTRSAADGGRVSIPGNDFYLFAPTGRATVENLRDDDVPSTYEARETLRLVDVNRVGVANLDISSKSASALVSKNSKIAFLRGLRVTGSAACCKAVDFYDDGMFLSELSGSTLSGQTAFHSKGARIRQARGTTFSFQTGAGVHLDGATTVFSELLDSVISSESATSGGYGLRINTANRNASIERMENTTVRRGPTATGSSGSAVAITCYSSDETYVRTQNVLGNVVCSQGAGTWKHLLDPEGAPTVAYDPLNVKGTSGARSFPWGDADDAAANPGFNQQKQWGGACP